MITLEQALTLLGMLTDTVTAQQRVIEQLQAENERLKGDDAVVADEVDQS